MKKLLLLFLFSSVSFAQEFEREYDKKVDLDKIKSKVENSGNEADLLDDSITDKADESKTEFDFENMLIDGKSKAPTGFLITGKKSQSLQRMVNLRKDFKRELQKSTDQLPALVK